MNGLKMALAGVMTIAAIVAFIIADVVRWSVTLPMAAGSLVGAYVRSLRVSLKIYFPSPPAIRVERFRPTLALPQRGHCCCASAWRLSRYPTAKAPRVSRIPAATAPVFKILISSSRLAPRVDTTTTTSAKVATLAARKAGLDDKPLGARFARIGEVPFSSERKLMSTVHSDTDRTERLLALTKGAPDVLLARCSRELVGEEARPLTARRRAEILASNEELAGQALRTLGVAFRSLPKGTSEFNEDVEQDLVFLGLIGMIDPPRDEAKDAVARAKGAGIRPIVITGDHPKTSAVIVGELGIATNGRVVTGAELEKMSDEMLDRTVSDVSVYARVNPKHKLRIVKALQHGGMAVAMTGDGVNDAPALKTADIGVAMGITGTDVSKEAADMVLADDNFASIVAAVEEGRSIFANIRKFLRYLLSSNIGEVMTMFFGVLLAEIIGLTTAGGGGVVLPLLATQILWINLVTDGAPALALGVDPPDPGVMNQPPRPEAKA
jgi:Ca2+-transporting ATPase